MSSNGKGTFSLTIPGGAGIIGKKITGGVIVRKRIGILFMFLLLLLCLPMTVGAEAARDISGTGCVTDSSGFSRLGALFDGFTKTGYKGQDHSHLTLESGEGIGSVYLIFDTEYGEFTVTNEDTAETVTLGQGNFLHTFVSMEDCFGEAPKSITLSFDNGPVPLLELSVFTPGEVPDWVQQWENPIENGADLVLFSTHADDEQLFFAGVLPYYAGELGYRVQVVYLTNHRNLSKDPTLRCHEALDGLWSVGVRAYPVFGTFGDYYTRNINDAYSIFHMMGVSDDDLLSFVVEQIRRFKPQVAVGHDLNGEYRHGEHMVYADLLTKAVEITADPQQFPESAERYGVWDIPKLYLHLYEENPIVMDWDQPLESFGGMTAYQVTKELGFPCHTSQQLDFAWYMAGADLATQVQKYSPCNYGLYRSTVGEDIQKNDFFENLTSYAQQEEQAAREEEQRRLAEEEAARQEALARMEPTEQTVPEPSEPTASIFPLRWVLPVALAALLAVLVVSLVCLLRRKK